MFVDHIEQHGRFVFEQACKLDLEGIVAKPKRALCRADVKTSPWIKIKNPTLVRRRDVRTSSSVRVPFAVRWDGWRFVLFFLLNFRLDRLRLLFAVVILNRGNRGVGPLPSAWHVISST